MLHPFEKTQIPVSVFHSRIETNRLPIFGDCTVILSHRSQSDSTKIMNTGIARMFALGVGQVFEGLRIMILLECSQSFLKRVGAARYLTEGRDDGEREDGREKSTVLNESGEDHSRDSQPSV